MKTAFDWISLAVFCGLIVLFLQRSTAGPTDRVIAYLPPALGCAVANYLGNGHAVIASIVVTAVTIAYIVAVLRPFARPP